MPTLWRQLTTSRAHPAVQFVKYMVSGGIVTVFSLAVFGVFAWKIFPALQEGELIVRLLGLEVAPLDGALRARHFLWCKVAEFLLANLLGYALNSTWVFERGRHSRAREMMLFYAVSFASFAAGTGLGAGLIAWGNIGAGPAYLANVAASILINYAGRKFLIFRR